MDSIAPILKKMGLTFSQIISPWQGDIVDSGRTGPTNHMPESIVSPQHGLIN
jgi:hypothetical protein